MAEIRRRLILIMFDSNKGVCGSPLTAFPPPVRPGTEATRVHSHSPSRNRHLAGAAMARAYAHSRTGRHSLPTPRRALRLTGSRVPRFSDRTGSRGVAGRLGTSARHGKIDRTCAGKQVPPEFASSRSTIRPTPVACAKSTILPSSFICGDLRRSCRSRVSP